MQAIVDPTPNREKQPVYGSTLARKPGSISVLWIRIRMFLGLPDPHPDPLDIGTDPRILIRTKMSRIHITDKNDLELRPFG
jgi:hypothetical protein